MRVRIPVQANIDTFLPIFCPRCFPLNALPRPMSSTNTLLHYLSTSYYFSSTPICAEPTARMMKLDFWQPQTITREYRPTSNSSYPHPSTQNPSQSRQQTSPSFNGIPPSTAARAITCTAPRSRAAARAPHAPNRPLPCPLPPHVRAAIIYLAVRFPGR